MQSINNQNNGWNQNSNVEENKSTIRDKYEKETTYNIQCADVDFITHSIGADLN